MSIEQIIRDIIRREGGFVEAKNDAGGATKFGISLRYARGLGLDLDGDGDTDRDDILLVDEKTAEGLYMRDFYFAPGIDKLPEGIQPQMVDIAVNSGAHRAIELLQRAINSLSTHRDDIAEDGRMGPQTRREAEDCVAVYGEQEFNTEIARERVEFFEDLVKRRPNQKRFLRGWIKRALEFE